MLRLLCLSLLLGVMASASAADLTVSVHGQTKNYSDRQLRDRPDARDINVPGDVAYRRTMTYRAVPLRALLPDLAPDAHLQFVASDGFAADIPVSVLLQRSRAEAWLAVEDPKHPWPSLPGKHVSAGPFYVVWLQPDAGRINPEQWPYQLATIREIEQAAQRFPAMRPSDDASARVHQGFEVFQRICMACHTLNGAGDATLGPDLNIPHSPTEYLRQDLLRAYIRDPQSLRHWPTARMPGFAPSVLSDADLDALLDYLHHMAGHKRSP